MDQKPDVVEEDFVRAMQELGVYIDILPADLVTLYHLAHKHAELREAESVRIGDIMTSDVVTVAPDVSLAYAAEQLLTHQVHNLPVVQREGSLVGMLNEDDVFAAVGLPCRHPLGRWWCKLARLFSHRPRVDGLTGLVREWMSPEPITAVEAETLQQVVERMEQKRVTTVVIMDERQRVRGIVTRSDVVRALVANDGAANLHPAC